MSEHTPGPWRWFVQGSGGVYLATERFGRLTIIDFVRRGMQGATLRFRDDAHCIMFKADHFVDPVQLTVDHPDARLIAAAPDLYEACDAARSHLMAICQALGELTQPGDVDCIRFLEAALQKARGVTP